MPDPRRIRVACRNCGKALAVAKDDDGKGRCPKCGAFENYRYREDLFPNSRFRMAYEGYRPDW